MGEYRSLVASILLRAVKDWEKESSEANMLARQLGFSSLREELETFFRSRPCEGWFDLLGMSFELVDARLGLSDG